MNVIKNLSARIVSKLHLHLNNSKQASAVHVTSIPEPVDVEVDMSVGANEVFVPAY